MARRYSDVLRGAELNQALNNYVDYIQNIDNRQTKRLRGGAPGEARPRRQVAVKPFGIEMGAGEFALVGISQASYTKLSSAIGARMSITSEALGGASKLDRFKPAKVNYFEPTSDSARSYVQSKLTKLYYLKIQGDSFSAPFGATTDAEEELAGSRVVKTAVYNIAPSKESRRVWFTPEKVPV